MVLKYLRLLDAPTEAFFQFQLRQLMSGDIKVNGSHTFGSLIKVGFPVETSVKVGQIHRPWWIFGAPGELLETRWHGKP